MSYTDQLKIMLRETLGGIKIGAIISAVITVLIFFMNRADNEKFPFYGYIEVLLFFTLLIGAVVAVINFGHSDATDGLLNGKIYDLTSGITASIFGGFLGSPLLMIIGVFKIAVGLIVLIPLYSYIAVSFVVTYIYVVIMSILEKKGKQCNKFSKEC